MAEAFSSRCVLLRIAEFPADGFLCTRANRRRRAQERRRGTRDRCVLQLCPEYAGGEKRRLSRRAARFSPDRWIQVGRSGRGEIKTSSSVIPGHAKHEPGISRFRV